MSMNFSKNKSSPNWTFTLDNYEDIHVAMLKALEVKYLVFGFEVAPTTGTPHLQGFMNLFKEKTMSALKKFIGIDKIHLEIARKDALANKDYCTKDGNFVEVGVRPIMPREKGLKEKERWEAARTSAKAGRLGIPHPSEPITRLCHGCYWTLGMTSEEVDFPTTDWLHHFHRKCWTCSSPPYSLRLKPYYDYYTKHPIDMDAQNCS